MEENEGVRGTETGETEACEVAKGDGIGEEVAELGRHLESWTCELLVRTT